MDMNPTSQASAHRQLLIKTKNVKKLQILKNYLLAVCLVSNCASVGFLDPVRDADEDIWNIEKEGRKMESLSLTFKHSLQLKVTSKT